MPCRFAAVTITVVALGAGAAPALAISDCSGRPHRQREDAIDHDHCDG